MPTYEYRCVDCGNRLEVFQSFNDEPLTTCEVCGGMLRKVIHPVGIQFKGSGFYSTDRRASHPMSRSNNKESKSEEGSDAKPDAKADAKEDGKPSSTPKPDSGASSTKGAAEKTGLTVLPFSGAGPVA